MEMASLSTKTVFGTPTNVSGYTAEPDDGDTFFTGGEDGAEGVFEIPVILKNGPQTSQLDAFIEFVPVEGVGMRGQCDRSSPYSNNGPTTVYYTIDGSSTQSVETCKKNDDAAPHPKGKFFATY